MKKTTCFLGILAALLAVGPARAADVGPVFQYGKALRARPITQLVKDFCDGRVGPENKDNASQYMSCKVTRFFVADALSYRTKIVPPGIDPIYMTEDEPDKIAEALGG